MSNNLTQRQTDDLDLGTRVIVTWSGGNGPHMYCVVENWRYSGAKVIPESCLQDLRWSPMSLEQVGDYPLTVVRLATTEEVYKEQANV